MHFVQQFNQNLSKGHYARFALGNQGKNTIIITFFIMDEWSNDAFDDISRDDDESDVSLCEDNYDNLDDVMDITRHQRMSDFIKISMLQDKECDRDLLKEQIVYL